MNPFIWICLTVLAAGVSADDPTPTDDSYNKSTLAVVSDIIQSSQVLHTINQTKAHQDYSSMKAVINNTFQPVYEIMNNSTDQFGFVEMVQNVQEAANLLNWGFLKFQMTAAGAAGNPPAGNPDDVNPAPTIPPANNPDDGSSSSESPPV